MRADLVFVGCRIAIMRMGRMVVAVVRMAMAFVSRIALMMSERHALAGHHRAHALKRHNQRDRSEQQDPNEFHEARAMVPQRSGWTKPLPRGSLFLMCGINAHGARAPQRGPCHAR